MDLTARIVHDPDVLLAARSDWDALLAKSAAPSPTLTPAWMLAWWRTFGPLGGRALRAVLFFDGARLVGLAPLLVRRARDRVGVPFRRIELLASGEDEADETCSDYIGVLAEQGEERAIADALAEVLTGPEFDAWDELALRSMNGDASLPLLLASSLRAKGCVARLEVTGVSHYVRLPRSWDDYLAALPSQRRYLVRRSMRDLEKWAAGTLAIHRARTAEDVDRGMQILAFLHAERWRAEGKAGVFESSRFRAFHTGAAPALLVADALDLSWMEAHGEPIAAAYNLLWDGKVAFYQSGRSMRLPKTLRPGIAQHAYAMRTAIEEGRREYDFLAGSSRYKTDLATDARPLVDLVATRASILAAARRATALALDEMRALRARAVSPA
jgi:CelD/BcsL family acetyltransferase involved in cellulose biosynthesis